MGICLGLVINTGLRVGPLGQRCGRREGPCLVQKGRQPLLSNFAHLVLLLPSSCDDVYRLGVRGVNGSPRPPLRPGYPTSTTVTTTGAGGGLRGMVGMIAFLKVSFTTPAKEAYQAAAAVAMPK